jgi:hypothetical protein
MHRRLLIAAIALLVALVVGGCGGASGEASSSGPANDQTQAAPISQAWGAHIRSWKRELLASANEDKGVRFPTPSQAALEEKLAGAASRFDFRVLSVEFVPAAQGSPLVIVESSSPTRFSRDTPAILRLLDPKRGGDQDWEGWDYEGFFLGAQDQQGEPFLAVFNVERAHGGGQWARSEELYPFEHG